MKEEQFNAVIGSEDEFPPLYNDEDFLFFEEEYSFFDLAKRMEELYISFRQRFVMMKNNKIFIPHAQTDIGEILPCKLTSKIMYGHLNEHFSIGVFAGKYSSLFVCFDVDDGDKNTVKAIIRALVCVGFPEENIYVSSSGGKGYHVEMFFDGLMYTSDLKKVYDYVCAKENLNTKKVEFRPTATQSIKLPLSRHAKTGNVCWYLDRNTLEPIKNKEYIMEIETISRDDATEIIRALPVLAPQKPMVSEFSSRVIQGKVLTEQEKITIEDGLYPDVQEEGQKNIYIAQIVVYNRYLGLSKEENRAELIDWLKRQNQDLIKTPFEESVKEIEYTLRWAYGKNFHMRSGGIDKRLTFTDDDIRIWAAQKERNDRKAMFLLLFYAKKIGRMEMSYKNIGKCLHVEPFKTAPGIMRRIELDGWIRKVAGKKKKISSEQFTQNPNSYFVVPEAFKWARGEFGTKFPHDEKVFDIKPVIKKYSIENKKFTENEENFLRIYADVLTHMVSKKDLRKIMGRSEYKELEQKGKKSK